MRLYDRLPVRGGTLILLMIATIFLSACTANTSSIDEHGLLPHLTVDMQLPTELSPGSIGQFHIIVGQKGEPVETAHVTFEFWPEGDSEQHDEVVGVLTGNGQYTAEYRFNSEGVYVVRARVSCNSLEVMPSKRFAIGEEAVLRLAALEQHQHVRSN